ncbi:GPI transamidase subunit PIG-U [Perilla frutescens var. frutescens]|nr:GPI transamidase subunit PIG-U [Perilla frutescens var. frutescens]
MEENSKTGMAEGYWLKQSSMSPYSGSMYHGSPLLLSILGPLTVKKIGGLSSDLLCSLVSVVADFISAILIRATGRSLVRAHLHNWKSLGLDKLIKLNEVVPSGDVAALVYLWNPFTIVSCIGFNTSPIENMFVIMSLYGASAGLVPLAAFGWVIASHLSLYPIVLVIPVIFLLGYGLDAPPRKLFVLNNLQIGEERSPDHVELKSPSDKLSKTNFSWWRVIIFFLWASIWTSYVLILCAISMKEYGGLGAMFKRTYGFILAIEDLSPNIGVLWYFFAEVFDFFRNFFLIVFHVNILFMILPLAIRLNHRPCFLAFVYLAVSSMLKSYPSVGDSALYLSLLVLFVNELAEMQFTFFLFCGYVGISLLSPVMHNLWIWRGTGNANFYFATAMGYACFQIILVVESVSAMLNYDRKIRKLCNKA